MQTASPNLCAYCRKPGRLTREHIHPKFIYEKFHSTCSGYNQAADKVTRGERTIKDVCATCNNDHLAKLDAYGHRYFLLNRLDQTFAEDVTVEVRYEYDLLLRWILKVSYNSFRTVEHSDDPFASLVPYILRGQARPKSKFVKLYLELIRDHPVPESERSSFPEIVQRMGRVPCLMATSGGVTNRFSEQRCHCRHFQVNAHLFTVFLFPYSTRAGDADDTVRIMKSQFPFSKYIDPNLDRITLRVSRRDILDVHAGIHVHPRERLREMEYAYSRMGAELIHSPINPN